MMIKQMKTCINGQKKMVGKNGRKLIEVKMMTDQLQSDMERGWLEDVKLLSRLKMRNCCQKHMVNVSIFKMKTKEVYPGG